MQSFQCNHQQTTKVKLHEKYQLTKYVVFVMEKKLDLLKKELFCPPMVKMLCNGGFWFTLGLNVPRRNLILCIHIVRSSPLLLIVVMGLAIRIESFSVVQSTNRPDKVQIHWTKYKFFSNIM